MSERFDFQSTLPGSDFSDPTKLSVVLFLVADGDVLTLTSAEFNPSCPNGAAADPAGWIFARSLNLVVPFDAGDGPTLVRLPGSGALATKRFDGKKLRGNGNNNGWLGRMGAGQTGPLVAPPWAEDFTLVGPTEVVAQFYTPEPTDQFVFRFRGVLTTLV